MDIAIIKECQIGAKTGKITFPEIVKKLSGIGIESYYADLMRGQVIYYNQSGKSHIEDLPFSLPAVAQDFKLEGVKSALTDVQAKRIHYPEFVERILAAGVQSYLIFLKGKKALYLGRQGECYTEHFPQKP